MVRKKQNKEYLEVISEYIREKFDIVSEGYSTLSEQIKLQGQETQDNFKTVFDYLSRIDDELQEVRVKRLENLEFRVAGLEKQLEIRNR